MGGDIRGNTAAGDGGGVYLGTGVGLRDFLLSRSAVWENDATRGGGVFVLGSSDTIYQIVNSTIGLNTANLGGGIFFVLGDLRILHSTGYPIGSFTYKWHQEIGRSAIWISTLF